jgi:outer membrane protein assembly factor BamB
VTPVGGLPEESLFSPPAAPQTQVRWPEVSDQPLASSMPISRPLPEVPWIVPCSIFPNDWWMYHHDAEHSGVASGCSDIGSTTVGNLTWIYTLALFGSIVSIPSIVDGKIYVGTSTDTAGGTLYKIDLVSGAVEHSVPIPFDGGAHHWGSGTGGSPAIVGDKVYLSCLDGKVRCWDTGSLNPIWCTDIRNPDPAQNQPFSRPDAACWSSPLVVMTPTGRIRVYGGSGLGEDGPGTYGMVFCLDGETGRVVWLFCTNKLTVDSDNSPDVFPDSTWNRSAVPRLPSSFSTAPDPRDAEGRPRTGASPWSSCVYDRLSNRVFIGTGNPHPDSQLPNWPYSSGVVALDADSGELQGFFQPRIDDSYRPTDADIDIGGSPVLYTSHGKRTLGIGSKNGSFFLLDPDSTPALDCLQRRQLLPYINDDPTQPLQDVDRPEGDPPENRSGVFGTAAVDYANCKLFVGLGGHDKGIDHHSTPFVRACDWSTLGDAWPTVRGPDGVTRYNIPSSPLYQTPGETGLSSPAVVNDVVFVSTNVPALYALDSQTGVYLWRAGDLCAPADGHEVYAMGPAVYGHYVVLGVQDGTLHVYSFLTVPDLIDDTLSEAEAVIRSVGLAVGRITHIGVVPAPPPIGGPVHPVDVVVAQSPSPGTRVVRGSAVNLTVQRRNLS